MKTLIRLDGCPGWSESSLGAHSFCWFCHVVAHNYDRTSKFIGENAGLNKQRNLFSKPCFDTFYFCWNMSSSMTKPRWPVHPAKTQISLGIRQVWSKSSLSAWRNLRSLPTNEHTAKTLIRLGGCPGWSESLLGAYMSFCWFVMLWLIFDFWELQASPAMSTSRISILTLMSKWFFIPNIFSLYIFAFQLRLCRKRLTWSNKYLEMIFHTLDILSITFATAYIEVKNLLSQGRCIVCCGYVYALPEVWKSSKQWSKTIKVI